MSRLYRSRFKAHIILASAVIWSGMLHSEELKDLGIPDYDGAYVDRIVDSGTNLQLAVSFQWFNQTAARKAMAKAIGNINPWETSDAGFMVIADHLGILKAMSKPVFLEYSEFTSNTDKILRDKHLASVLGISMNGSVDRRYSPTRYVWRMYEIQMKRNADKVADYRRQSLSNIKPLIHQYISLQDVQRCKSFVEEFSLRAILTHEEKSDLFDILDNINDASIEADDVP